MLTSALADTVAVDDAVSLLGLVSAVAVVTVAVFCSAPVGADDSTFSVKVNVACAPDASEAIVQLAVVCVFPQANVGPVFCASDTNDVLPGNESVSETLAAGDGPALATVIV